MDTQPMIEHLRRAQESVRRKIEETKTSLAQAEEDLHNIIGTISFYERNLPMREIARPSMNLAPMKPMGTFGPSSLHGMSHRQAVVAIAKHNNGTIKAQEAKRLMIQAGVMRDTKNSTHMVHNAIITSERFERIGRGEFRLKPIGIVVRSAPATGVANSEELTRMVGTTKPVQ